MAADETGRRTLLTNPAVAALVTDLALKAGAYAIRRGADRLFGDPVLTVKPRRKGKAMLIAAPVAAIVGTGALAGFLYRRSEARRARKAGKKA